MTNKKFLSISTMFVMAVMLSVGVQSASFAEMADNTGVNKRDSALEAVTADEQSQSPEDMKITADIRSGILSDQALSTYAHNIKIIVQNGKVTLKGPVRSSDEQEKIKDIASGVVGYGNISNELNVVSP